MGHAAALDGAPALPGHDARPVSRHVLALPMLLAHARVLARRRDPGVAAQRTETERYLEHMVSQAPWRILLPR